MAEPRVELEVRSPRLIPHRGSPDARELAAALSELAEVRDQLAKRQTNGRGRTEQLRQWVVVPVMAVTTWEALKWILG